MYKIFLLLFLTIFFIGCDNEEKNIYEFNKKILQEEILNESQGVIELVDIKIISSAGNGSNFAKFTAIIEFKEDAWKKYSTNLATNKYSNPFRDFIVYKNNPNDYPNFQYNNFYRKGEHVSITGKTYLADGIKITIETEGDVKLK